jgi:hypothetical protein
MVTVGQNFEGPNADIKETAPARGNCTDAALIQTPDRGGPIGAFPQHWNIPVRLNTSRPRGKGSKRSVLIRVTAIQALADTRGWRCRPADALHPN